MRSTIDKAGRVVIPAALRERMGLIAGTEIEIEADETGIRLVRRVDPPKLVRVGKRLVAKPTARARERPAVDIAQVIDRERDRWPW